MHADFRHFIARIEKARAGSRTVSEESCCLATTCTAFFVAVAEISIGARIAVGSEIIERAGDIVTRAEFVDVAVVLCRSTDVVATVVAIVRADFCTTIANFNSITASSA